MKPVLLRAFLLVFSFMIFIAGIFSQDARVLLKFEDAEKAYNNGRFLESINYIDEVEALAGVSSKTLYLRIVASFKIFDDGKNLYMDPKNFDQLVDLRTNASKYLEALSSQGIDDKYREVYRISKYLDQFPIEQSVYNDRFEKIKDSLAVIKPFLDNCIFDSSSLFYHGIAKVLSNGKWGAINKNGELVIPFIFDEIGNHQLDSMVIIAKLKNKWGIIDFKGNWILPPIYDKGSNFSNGLAPFKNIGDNKVYYLDRRGKKVFDVKAAWGTSFSRDGIAIVRHNNSYAYINTAGKTILNAEGRNVFSASEGIIVLGFKYYNNKGKLIFALKPSMGYTKAGNFFHGLAPVVRNKKYGFIDRTGKEVIDAKYDQITYLPFNEFDLNAVKIGDKWGYIDSKGHIVIKPIYELAFNFSDGLALIKRKDGLSGNLLTEYITPTGKTQLLRPSFIQLSGIIYSEGLTTVKVNGKYGWMDKQGRVLLIKQLNLAH